MAVILQMHFLNGNAWNFMPISRKYVPNGPIEKLQSVQ